MSGLKMVPMRTLGDFLLDSKRYSAPAFSDMKRLNNRITSNLLYYQTNYLAFSTLVFLLFLIFGFNKILLGAFGISTSVIVALFAMNRIPQLSPLKSQYPAAIYILGAVNLITVYLTFRPILYVALALLVPVVFWISHASLRSRGIKNKINNKMEQMGASVYASSPMGHVLAALGYETKDYEE